MTADLFGKTCVITEGEFEPPAVGRLWSEGSPAAAASLRMVTDAPAARVIDGRSPGPLTVHAGQE